MKDAIKPTSDEHLNQAITEIVQCAEGGDDHSLRAMKTLLNNCDLPTLKFIQKKLGESNAADTRIKALTMMVPKFKQVADAMVALKIAETSMENAMTYP